MRIETCSNYTLSKIFDKNFQKLEVSSTQIGSNSCHLKKYNGY